MSQRNRIFIGLAVLIALIAVVLGLENLRGRASLTSSGGQVTLTPGSIPIYFDGELAAGFTPDSLEGLEQALFVDAEEGKPQDGYLLRDVLLTYLPRQSLAPDTKIIVTSSSRNKTAELTWSEVDEQENMVMFDISNKGTLKLVSLLDKLDTRDEWVQDVDRIDLVSP